MHQGRRVLGSAGAVLKRCKNWPPRFRLRPIAFCKQKLSYSARFQEGRSKAHESALSEAKPHAFLRLASCSFAASVMQSGSNRIYVATL